MGLKKGVKEGGEGFKSDNHIGPLLAFISTPVGLGLHGGLLEIWARAGKRVMRVMRR